MDNKEKMLKLNLSQSVIPRNCMDWNQWFWYTEMNPNPNVTITIKYLKMDTPHEEKNTPNDESWNATVKMCYLIGTLVLLGTLAGLYYLLPSLIEML